MLESLITSKTRIKLLLKFFLNPETETYLRELAKEMGESTNGIRIELDRFTAAKLLNKRDNGKTKVYRANTTHSFFPEIHSAVKKYIGIDSIINEVLAKIGNLEYAYIVGDYARGLDSGIIDVVIIGNIDQNYLHHLIGIADDIIKRKIRSLVLSREEFEQLKETLKIENAVMVWGDKR